jgi:hypothetical protein
MSAFLVYVLRSWPPGRRQSLHSRWHVRHPRCAWRVHACCSHWRSVRQKRQTTEQMYPAALQPPPGAWHAWTLLPRRLPLCWLRLLRQARLLANQEPWQLPTPCRPCRRSMMSCSCATATQHATATGLQGMAGRSAQRRACLPYGFSLSPCPATASCSISCSISCTAL